METVPKGLTPQRLTALLKVAYTELQFWLVGMTPEGYHFQQSRNYDQLGAPSRSAYHAHEVLKYAEYPEPRARLGYHYANLGRHAEAAEHYRKAVQAWPHPSIMLALAQSELRIGNYVTAAEWLERTEKSEMKAQLENAIAEVSSELAAANNAPQATCEDARA
jgi:hypothetical protein